MNNGTRKQHGMMMLECMIAVLVFAIGVLGMVKMQALSTANSVNSEDRATAAMLANDAIAELWSLKTATMPSADLTTWQTRVSDALASGNGAITTTGNVAQVTITWAGKGGATAGTAYGTATYMTQVTIQ